MFICLTPKYIVQVLHSAPHSLLFTLSEGSCDDSDAPDTEIPTEPELATEIEDGLPNPSSKLQRLQTSNPDLPDICFSSTLSFRVYGTFATLHPKLMVQN